MLSPSTSVDYGARDGKFTIKLLKIKKNVFKKKKSFYLENIFERDMYI